MNDRSPDIFALSLSPLSSSVRQRFVGAFWHLCVMLIQTPSRNSRSFVELSNFFGKIGEWKFSANAKFRTRGGLSIVRRNGEMNFSTNDLYELSANISNNKYVLVYQILDKNIRRDIYVSLFLAKKRNNINRRRNLSWFYRELDCVFEFKKHRYFLYLLIIDEQKNQRVRLFRDIK